MKKIIIMMIMVIGLMAEETVHYDFRTDETQTVFKPNVPEIDNTLTTTPIVNLG